MLKMLRRIHGRLLVLIVISAVLFIAGRKVMFIAYTSTAVQAIEATDDVSSGPQTDEIWSLPFFCKALRVTADYSKLKMEWNAFFSFKLGSSLDSLPSVSPESGSILWNDPDFLGRSTILRI